MVLSQFRIGARNVAFPAGWSWRLGGRKYTTVHVRARPLPSDTHQWDQENRMSSSSVHHLTGLGGWPTYRDRQAQLTSPGSSRHYASGSSSPDQSGSESDKVANKPEVKDPAKMSYWERFKQMYKEYWYVLIPVHCATSVVWYGSFYYIAKSGVDIVPLLQQLGAGEALLKPLRDTGAGFFAVAYAMYKLATPARYTITLGGTTLAINYLRRWGVIKPMPSSEQMREMIREKGRELRSRRARVLAKMNLKRQGGGNSGNGGEHTKGTKESKD